MEGEGEAPRTTQGLRARLSRITSSGRFIPEIDGLRFIAISAVVLYHLAAHLRSTPGFSARDSLYVVVAQGFFGVQLFFVISGFILVLPFLESRLGDRPSPSLGRYYARRLVRLEPPYFINLLLLAGAMLVFEESRAAEVWPRLLASLTYTHNLVFGGWSTIKSVAWSLEVEVQFYLITPFIARIFYVRNGAVRRVLLVFLILAAALISERIRLHHRTVFQLSLAGQFQYFLLGFLLADWYATDFRKAPGKSYRWDALGLLAAAGLGVGLIKVATPRPLLLPLILLMYMAAFRGRVLNVLISLPWVTAIGGMCYTIYLYHVSIMQIVGAWSGKVFQPAWPFWLNYLVQLAFLAAPLLILCALLFVMLERPFMRPLQQSGGAILPAGTAAQHTQSNQKR